MLGGGRSYFTPGTVQDPETGVRGRRRDGKDLVDQWLNDHADGVYVTNRDQLLALDPNGPGPVFGNNPFKRLNEEAAVSIKPNLGIISALKS